MAKKKKSAMVLLGEDLNKVFDPQIDVTQPDDDILSLIEREIKGTKETKGIEFYSDDPFTETTWKFLKEKWGIDRENLAKAPAKTTESPTSAEKPSVKKAGKGKKTESKKPEKASSKKPVKKAEEKKPAKKEKPAKADSSPNIKTNASESTELPKEDKTSIKKTAQKKVNPPKEKKKMDWLGSREGGQAFAINEMLFKGSKKQDIVDMLNSRFGLEKTMAPNGKPRSAKAWLGSYLNKIYKKEAMGRCRVFVDNGGKIKVQKPLPEPDKV